ncbi:MAG: hypothetical protein FWD99_02595 [Oscillospiraceae bacterium]|nr:hypothetical protein [Oscillospiraceae bacterium]
MRKQKDIVKVALGSLFAIGLFGFSFLIVNHVSFAVAANETVQLPALAETITIPEILTLEEFPMPDVTLVRVQTFHSMQIEERDFIMSMEEAARLGALYIWDVFGERIDGMIIEMTYGWAPAEELEGWAQDHAQWAGLVSLFDEDRLRFMQKEPWEWDALREADPDLFDESMEILWAGRQFYFSIDAITGNRLAINRPHMFHMERADDPSQTVTREEAGEANNLWHRVRMAGEPDPFPLDLTEEELALYLQLAHTYAQRHFLFVPVADVVFESAWPAEFDRDETGEIIAIDFLLSFAASDETGRTISLSIFRNEQRLNGLNAWF